MRARQFVLHAHYSMYRRCPQRWRIATVATDTPPNLLPVQGLYCRYMQSNRQRAFLIIGRMYFRSLSVFCGFVDIFGMRF